MSRPTNLERATRTERAIADLRKAQAKVERQRKRVFVDEFYGAVIKYYRSKLNTYQEALGERGKESGV